MEEYFEKYFENKCWSSARGRIITVGGPDPPFPSVPSGAVVWDWISHFQERYLEPEQARGLHYTMSSKKDLTGPDTERQLDLLMKSREARARGAFGAQPTRLFVRGFLLLGTTMNLHVFDRPGAFSALAFVVVKDLEHFIHVLKGYALMSDEELGMDTFVRWQGKRKLMTLLDDDDNGEEQQFEVWSTPIARQSATVSRAMFCCCTMDGTSMVKFAWQSPKKVWEVEHLREVHG